MAHFVAIAWLRFNMNRRTRDKPAVDDAIGMLIQNVIRTWVLMEHGTTHQRQNSIENSLDAFSFRARRTAHGVIEKQNHCAFSTKRQHGTAQPTAFESFIQLNFAINAILLTTCGCGCPQ